MQPNLHRENLNKEEKEDLEKKLSIFDFQLSQKTQGWYKLLIFSNNQFLIFGAKEITYIYQLFFGQKTF